MKTSRKIFRWITVFAMFLTLMAPVFAAQDYGITWEITEDGVLTISGNGEITDFPWNSQTEIISKVVIEEGITGIGNDAFISCVNLEEVVFPDSLMFIGDSIFRTEYLKRVFIPARVCELSSYAFQYCTNLERIDVSPENAWFTSDSMGVVYSKDMTMLLMAPTGFQGSYTILGTVRSVGGEYAYEYYREKYDDYFQVREAYSPFRFCERLTDIHFSAGVETIGASAFRGCDGLTEIIIPDSVFRVDDYAFAGCSFVESLHIGSGVKVIGDHSFDGLRALTELIVPGNVRNIGIYAFAESDNLEKVFFEDGIRKIGKYAFLSCFKLKELRLPGTLWQITESAFRNCYELVNVTIPANVTSIESLAFDNIEGL